LKLDYEEAGQNFKIPLYNFLEFNFTLDTTHLPAKRQIPHLL